MSKANKTQVGGSHYQNTIQVWDFVHQNGIQYLEGNIIKYIARHRDKNGFEDLMKARHYLDKLIEVEESAMNERAMQEQALMELAMVEELARGEEERAMEERAMEELAAARMRDGA